VSKAAVTLAKPDNKAQRTASSDEAGRYLFPQAPPGN
jgi:hypothetical protein